MGMETYKVQAPNGEIIVMEGPSGATDEQLFAQAKMMMGQKPQGSVTVESAPPTQHPAFGQTEGGAALGRAHIGGKLNVQAEPRPLESFMAGATKSLVTDPILGTTQLLSGGNVGNDMARRIQSQADVYKDASPEAFVGGQITGAVAPVMGAGGVIGKIPSMERIGASLLKEFPKAGQYINRIGSGMGYGAVGSTFSPDTEGQDANETMQNRLAKMLLDTSIGGAIPASVDVIKPVIKGAGKIGSEILGMTTGTSGEVLREAYKAGKKGTEEFMDNMRGSEPVSKILEAAQSAMSTMKQNRRDAFEKGFESTKKNQVFLDFKPIEDKFNQIVKNLDYEGVGGVSVGKVGKKTMESVNEVKALIKEWKSKPEVHTAEGLDSLKRRIDDLWSNDLSNEAKSIITQTRGTVKNTISKQDKNYSKTMKEYEDALETERNIEKALGLGDKTAADTAIRKLQSLGRNNANTNYGYRQELADIIKNETGVDFMPALAGQALNSWTPRGINKTVGSLTTGTAIGGTMLAGPAGLVPLATLPFQSPRAMGEALYAMGKASSKMPTASMTDEQKKLAQLLLQESILKGKEE